MALGLGFSFGFGRLSGSRPILSVTITWDGDDTDSRPDFDVDLPFGNGPPQDAAANDVLRLEYSTDGGSIWNAYLTHTLTADEIAGDPITVNGVNAVSNGVRLFRARLERGTKFSAWSASESVTINAPVNKRNVIIVMRAR